MFLFTILMLPLFVLAELIKRSREQEVLMALHDWNGNSRNDHFDNFMDMKMTESRNHTYKRRPPFINYVFVIMLVFVLISLTIELLEAIATAFVSSPVAILAILLLVGVIYIIFKMFT